MIEKIESTVRTACGKRGLPFRIDRYYSLRGSDEIGVSLPFKKRLWVLFAPGVPMGKRLKYFANMAARRKFAEKQLRGVSREVLEELGKDVVKRSPIAEMQAPNARSEVPVQSMHVFFSVIHE